MSGKSRSAKTTRGQYIIYLTELENNLNLRKNKFEPVKPDILEDTWKELTTKLNSVGGPVKTVKEWKKVLADWKSSVRKKARLLKISQQKTGGGPPEKPLTDIEEKLLDLTGIVTIEGLPVPELGIQCIGEQEEEPENDGLRKSTPERSDNAIAGPSNVSQKKQILHNIENVEDQSCPKKKHIGHKQISSVKQTLNKLLEIKTEDLNNKILCDINNNLQELVELKKKEINLKEAKYKLKYGIEFVYREESFDDN